MLLDIARNARYARNARKKFLANFTSLPPGLKRILTNLSTSSSERNGKYRQSGRKCQEIGERCKLTASQSPKTSKNAANVRNLWVGYSVQIIRRLLSFPL